MGVPLLLIIKDTALVERYGVMMLSAVLKRAGHSVHLVRAQRCSLEELRETVARLEPAALLFSAMTGEHQYLLEVNRRLKETFDPAGLFNPGRLYQ